MFHDNHLEAIGLASWCHREDVPCLMDFMAGDMHQAKLLQVPHTKHHASPDPGGAWTAHSHSLLFRHLDQNINVGCCLLLLVVLVASKNSHGRGWKNHAMVGTSLLSYALPTDQLMQEASMNQLKEECCYLRFFMIFFLQSHHCAIGTILVQLPIGKCRRVYMFPISAHSWQVAFGLQRFKDGGNQICWF